MPIGYIVGNSYRIDAIYDRYAKMPVFKRIVAEAGKRGYGAHVTYSPMNRGYCCEVRKVEPPFKNSAHRYYQSIGHKYASDPLTATIDALAQCVPSDPLMLVLYLEAQVELLKIEYADRVALEKRLDSVLVQLFMAVALGWGHVTRAEIAETGGFDASGAQLPGGGKSVSVTVQEFRADHLGAAFLGKPLPDDIDDDL